MEEKDWIRIPCCVRKNNWKNVNLMCWSMSEISHNAGVMCCFMNLKTVITLQRIKDASVVISASNSVNAVSALHHCH